MSAQEQVKKIKCPHCGWPRKVPVSAIVDASETSVVQGPGDKIKILVGKISQALKDPLDEANAWLDMPACPNCHNVYQYNVHSGETRP